MAAPITFQSDNGKAFVGDLTKELMKRSQVAQAPLDHLSPANEWPSREAESHTGIHVGESTAHATWMTGTSTCHK